MGVPDSAARPSRAARRAADRPVAQLIVEATRVEHDAATLVRLAAEVDPDHLYDAAVHHRVAGLVASALSKAGVPVERLDWVRNAQLATYLRSVTVATTVGEAFAEAGIRWALLKGPTLSVLYGRPDARPFGDLDLLVDGADLEAAVDVLVAGGGTVLDTNWPLIAAEMPGELAIMAASGHMLDLHWDVVNDSRIRPKFAISTAQLLDRSESVTVAGRAIPALGMADRLLHAALHGTLSGGHRLVWYADVDRVARHVEDWDDVVRRARSLGLGLVLSCFLRTTQRLLGTPLPARQLSELTSSRAWVQLARLADATRPPQLAFRPGPTGRMIQHCTRATTLRSLRALAEETAVHAHLVHRPFTAPAMGDDVPDPAARSHFFATAAKARFAAPVG